MQWGRATAFICLQDDRHFYAVPLDNRSTNETDDVELFCCSRVQSSPATLSPLSPPLSLCLYLSFSQNVDVLGKQVIS